ncbi:hypothetical protein B0T24DRAFT_701790 [Lasiosphaeria ovina]|uniref:Rhodopsin domain-containing protein n=1 Tax=Lasiosphaeria ovina TaxID=92902 RepID=A0AAE0KJH1_9PEZI|nr:hypothetical protein B0T24DRAFT_701790 [Lasiosphaeria ovina]
MSSPLPSDGSGGSLHAGRAPVETTGPAVEIAGWFLVAISGLFLGLRIYCKHLKHRGLWWDDWILTTAWLALLADAIINTICKPLGLGMHLRDINPDNLSTLAFLGYLGASFSMLGAVWSKTSFALTLLRIATSKKMKVAVWSIILTMNLTMTANVILTWVQCNPIPKGWNMAIPGSCWDLKINAYYGVFAGVYSGLMDIVLSIIPWAIVWNLQMKRKEKIGVAVAMSMGVFAGSAAFVKSAKILLVLDGDFIYEGYNLIIWGNVEVAVAIMAASVPVLRVLVREVRIATRRRYGQGAESASNDTTFHKKNFGGGTLHRSSTVMVTAGHQDRLLDSSSSSSSINWEIPHILDPQKAVPGRILQTQEITVQYHERDVTDTAGRMV